MTLFKLSKPFLFLLATSVLFSACKKEEVNNDDQDFPIELTVTKPDRNVMLSWTKTNISNFEGYFLVRSTEPIEDFPEPVGTFQEIDDFEENTFEDTSFPLAEEVFYKVYVKVGERFLFSPTVSIQFDVNLLDLQASRIVHDADAELLFIFDNNLRTLFRYDLKTEEVTHDLEDFSTFDYIMTVGDAGEGTELFLSSNGSPNLRIYDDKFNLRENINVNSSIVSLEVGDGVFITATQHFSQPMVIYDRNTLNQIETSDFADSFDRRLKLLPGENNVLVDASFEQIIVYQMTSNWQVANVQSTFLFTNPLQEVVASPDGEHFIPNLEGQVFDLGLDVVGEVSTPNQVFFQDYLFSADGSKVYAFNFSPGRLIEFSFPDIEEIRTIDLNYNPIKAFLSNDGELIIVGLVPEFFQQKSIVDILKL